MPRNSTGIVPDRCSNSADAPLGKAAVGQLSHSTSFTGQDRHAYCGRPFEAKETDIARLPGLHRCRFDSRRGIPVEGVPMTSVSLNSMFVGRLVALGEDVHWSKRCRASLEHAAGQPWLLDTAGCWSLSQHGVSW